MRESLRGRPEGDPSDDPSDPQDPGLANHPNTDDSGEETDTSIEQGNKRGIISRRGPRERIGPHGHPGPQGPRGYPGPSVPAGRDGFVQKGVGANATLDTSGLERSFAEYGRVMQDAILGQNQINMTIADQLEVSIDTQNKHVAPSHLRCSHSHTHLAHLG